MAVFDLTAVRLGVTAGEIELLTREDNQRVALALSEQARLSLDLYSRDLEPLLYDNDAFYEAVKQLALSSPRSRVRILLADSSLVVKRGHRLLRLAQRLSSSIEIRKPHSDYKEFNQTFLLADARGYLHRFHSDRYEGNADFNAPLKARELGNFFTEVWDKSLPDPELRQHPL